ncbi:hypothetical protein COV06_02750 [Candidatus Uhrbacteria bacterium CG10_big_fil_rev_8_21_14_0_10_50_16]|uniref:Peptidase S11 D-alanyl-D-alanine carboxypeptidase A N-terminal domain-containing protein n=1 Tax=Candidatus Uhrbacteria bacterium CG10_big_fil_rev_8_21_14_0_10_50_16 TaxID=1975039 RepID=A0A2H0RM05_9BACT|nr:MAG: hypothetical protein COV06_02750 [Candidatus Uhrbacteria bacterium CG10_big_fil_rev_8_21_14_0_10_50_16]
MRVNAVVNVLLALVLTPFAMTPTTSPSSVALSDVIARAVQIETGSFPLAGHRGPQRVDVQSLGVVTDAPSVLIRDVETGVPLMQRGEEIKRPIASITKLMTALVLLEDYTWNWEDAATVKQEDVTVGGRWYYRFNDALNMEDLFTMMLVASGNNETHALVREVGATQEEFVAKMNRKAEQIGMQNATFGDPIGLDPHNAATAQDVMVLLNEALQHEEIASRVAHGSVHVVSGIGNVYDVEGTNELFHSFLNQSPYKVVGGKTGSLDEAGYCLTTRIERDGHLVDVVVLGASQPEARFSDAKDLVSWAFDVFSWERDL